MFVESLKTNSNSHSSGISPEAEEGESHSDHAWVTQWKTLAKQNQAENIRETCPVGFWDNLLMWL